MTRPGRMGTTAQRLRMLPGLLLGALLFLACGEDSNRSVEGPFFQAPETPPPGKALVYIYWPPQGRRVFSELHVWPSGGHGYLARGGFSRMAHSPGRLHFSASKGWTVSSRSTVVANFAETGLEVQSGETYFLRVEEKLRLGFVPDVELQLIEAAAALPEIRKCRGRGEIPWTVSDQADGPGDSTVPP